MIKRQLIIVSIVSVMVCITNPAIKVNNKNEELIYHKTIINQQLTMQSTQPPLRTAILGGRTITINKNVQIEAKQIQKSLSRGGELNFKTVDIVATAYCNDYVCTNSGKGITASGKKAKWGMVATPYDIPFGSIISIDDIGQYTDGLETFTVQDRGSKSHIKWIDSHTVRIDIWFPTHKQALEFGVKKFTGTIIYNE